MCLNLAREVSDPNSIARAVLAEDSPLVPENASAALMGCATLGVQSEPKVVGVCWRALVSDGGFNRQALANSAWALAVLEV